MTLRTHFDEGEYYGFYVLPIIDVFDRVIVNYHIGLNCTAQDAARTIPVSYTHLASSIVVFPAPVGPVMAKMPSAV